MKKHKDLRCLSAVVDIDKDAIGSSHLTPKEFVEKLRKELIEAEKRLIEEWMSINYEDAPHGTNRKPRNGL